MDKETTVLSKIMPIFAENYDLKRDATEDDCLEQIYAIKRILGYIANRYKTEIEKTLEKITREYTQTSEYAKEIERLNNKILELKEASQNSA